MLRLAPAWLLALVAGCAFDPRGLAGEGDGDAALDGPEPDARIDAGDPPPDAPTDAALTARTLVDDSAADFTAGPPVLAETRIEAAGAVAPVAYYQGSLCAGGNSELLFGDANAPTATGAILPAPTRVGLPRSLAIALPNNTAPPGLGIVGGTDWTMWWWGELYLVAGSHTFTLTADDHGFLELRAPAAAAYTKVVSANWDQGDESASYQAPVTGWYPVRVALAQRAVGSGLTLRLDGQPIGRRLTRCRVDGFVGLAQTAFDQSHLLDVAATAIEPDATAANVDWGSGSPVDLGLTNADTFTVRWAGQFFIQVAGTYRLRVRSDDGFRLWVDGTRVAAAFDDFAQDQTTSDLVLARGWHDLVLDTTENMLNARSQLTVAAGPELVGLPFPPSRLRPAEGRLERFESLTAPARSTPDAVMFGFDPRPGATVSGVDVGYQIDVSDVVTNITTVLRAGAQGGTLRSAIGGDTTDRFHPVVFDNQPFATAWNLTATVASGTATLVESWLTVHHRDPAGSGPTPLAASYESSVRDLLAPGGAAVDAIDRVSFDVRAAAGATVTMALRTCDDPAACAAEPYSPGLASGATPAVTPRRYLQYRLDLVTDGDHEPAVERVQLDYRTR